MPPENIKILLAKWHGKRGDTRPATNHQRKSRPFFVAQSMKLHLMQLHLKQLCFARVYLAQISISTTGPRQQTATTRPGRSKLNTPNNHELAAYLDQQSAILRLPVQNVSQYASCSQDSNIALNEALRCLLARDYAANSLHRFLASLPDLLRAQGADSSHWPRLLPCGRAPAGTTGSELAFSPNGQILAGPVWDWMAAAASGIETEVASGAELCQKPATPPPFSGIDCSGSGFSADGRS
jgi:hypothetical protein